MNTRLSRITIRISLAAVLLISAYVVIASVHSLESKDKEPWAAIAAALAVITSVVSTWSAQRLLEIQQDSVLPDPIPSIDVSSRYGLMQLRVTNFGGSPAYKTRISWDKPLTRSEEHTSELQSH